MKLSLEPLRGMRDILPPESELLVWLCNRFREVARSYGYREVIAPTVERFELFALKSGEEIRRSMYVFKDKAGREVALRPELTPSVIRIYLRSLRAHPKPVRLFYVANVFRYDEPQFGRYREFTQGGVEIIGGASRYYDLELIALLKDYYSEIGLKNYRFKIGHMGHMRALARRAGLDESEEERFLHLIDKRMFDEAKKMLSRGGSVEVEVLERFISLESVDPAKLRMLSEEIREIGLNEVSEHLRELADFAEELSSLNVNYFVDLGFARGLAYYTGFIFEVVVPGMNISIAGGGRYDGLTATYGGPPEASTGFAIGIERTLIALKSQRGEELGNVVEPRGRVLVIALSPQLLGLAYRTAQRLRRQGFAALLEVSEPRKISRWLSYAEKVGVRYVVIAGPREAERGSVVVRDLVKWRQDEIPLDSIEEHLVSLEG